MRITIIVVILILKKPWDSTGFQMSGGYSKNDNLLLYKAYRIHYEQTKILDV
jgi:hypothetical protein